MPSAYVKCDEVMVRLFDRSQGGDDSSINATWRVLSVFLELYFNSLIITPTLRSGTVIPFL